MIRNQLLNGARRAQILAGAKGRAQIAAKPECEDLGEKKPWRCFPRGRGRNSVSRLAKAKIQMPMEDLHGPRGPPRLEKFPQDEPTSHVVGAGLEQALLGLCDNVPEPVSKRSPSLVASSRQEPRQDVHGSQKVG